MKKNLAEIIFVVDRSGSMWSIQKDMIGGFNAFIKEQKKVPGECKVSFFQFDTENPKEKVYEGLDLSKVPDLNEETFVPRSGTPLYDSLAYGIRATGDRLAETAEEDRPERVIFVVITDGGENSSTEWKAEQVKQMIEHQEEKYDWKFVYMGANQDAWAEGGAFGMKQGSTLGYVASKGGVDKAYKSLAKGVTSMRCCASSVALKDMEAFDEEDREDQKEEGYTH